MDNASVVAQNTTLPSAMPSTSANKVKQEKGAESEEEDFGAAVARAKREARQKDEARRSKSRQPAEAIPPAALDTKPSRGLSYTRPKLGIAISTAKSLVKPDESTVATKEEGTPRESTLGSPKSASLKSASSVTSKYAGLKIAKKRKSDEQNLAEPGGTSGDKLFVSDHSSENEAKERPAKRPFAPAKKPSKVHKPTYDQM